MEGVVVVLRGGGGTGQTTLKKKLFFFFFFFLQNMTAFFLARLFSLCDLSLSLPPSLLPRLFAFGTRARCACVCVFVIHFLFLSLGVLRKKKTAKQPPTTTLNSLFSLFSFLSLSLLTSILHSPLCALLPFHSSTFLKYPATNEGQGRARSVKSKRK